MTPAQSRGRGAGRWHRTFFKPWDQGLGIGFRSTRPRDRERRRPGRDGARPKVRVAPDLRDHLAPGRRQDDADREAARRSGAIQQAGAVRGARRKRAAHALGLDGDRAAARHLDHLLGDDLRAPRADLQPARYAGPLGLLRGHLPHADRRRRRGHGDRRRQGHRGADAEAVRGLPAARHPDHHLRQQGRPRGQGPARDPRRDRRHAGARRDAGRLAARAWASTSRAASISSASADRCGRRDAIARASTSVDELLGDASPTTIR